MYPFIHIGRFSVGTFGIMLWLAAVAACWILYRNFRRWGIEADAISIVAVSTVAGVLGSKIWHVLETPHALLAHPADLLFDRAGFAWYGGLIVGILTLLWQARVYKLGSLQMLDLASPAAAIGYGVGRLGCLVSGDGDYGIPTTLPWGMSFPHGLVPTFQRVHPTPIYELLGALLITWILWRSGAPERPKPLGQITGRIPHPHWHCAVSGGIHPDQSAHSVGDDERSAGEFGGDWVWAGVDFGGEVQGRDEGHESGAAGCNCPFRVEWVFVFRLPRD